VQMLFTWNVYIKKMRVCQLITLFKLIIVANFCLMSVMGVLGLGLGLKESLRTIFKSLSSALKDKSLALALKVKSLALFPSPWSWPCKSLHLLCFLTRRSSTADLQQCLYSPIIRLSLATIRVSCG